MDGVLSFYRTPSSEVCTMFSSRMNFFPALPYELQDIIFKKLPSKDLARHRLVCRTWNAGIEELLFDQELRNNKFKLFDFYTPIFEKLNIAEVEANPRTWSWLENTRGYSRFYRSPQQLFADNSHVKSCYKVKLTYMDMINVKVKLNIQRIKEIKRYTMTLTFPKEKICSFLVREGEECIEYANPFSVFEPCRCELNSFS